MALYFAGGNRSNHLQLRRYEGGGGTSLRDISVFSFATLAFSHWRFQLLCS